MSRSRLGLVLNVLWTTLVYSVPVTGTFAVWLGYRQPEMFTVQIIGSCPFSHLRRELTPYAANCGTNGMAVYDFLLANNSNFLPILHYF